MKYTLLILVIFIANVVLGQGYFVLKDQKSHTFSFELVNHSVIIPISINGVALSFLLDTGVKETILFGDHQDSLSLDNVHKVRFAGLGIEDGIEGLLALSNTVDVGDALIDTNHNIYIILTDHLDISSHIGTEINGIMGSKFFQDYVIEMDYIKKRITIHPKNFIFPEKILRKFERVPFTIERDRPYITTPLLLHKKWVDAKLLIDMGNTEALMLFPYAFDQFKVAEPYVQDYIGKGFSGDIFGQRNRIEAFKIGNYSIRLPIVSYPDSTAVKLTKIAEDRKGSIGNQILERFHVFIDYPNEQLFIRKNKNFGKPFYFNISGIDVKHDGMIWSKEMINMTTQRNKKDIHQTGTHISFDTDSFRYQFKLKPVYVVAGVRKGSPAEKAGVQVGDELLKINGKNISDMTLLAINTKLQKASHHDLKLVLLRNGEEVKLSFQLIDPIPFENQ